MSALQCEKQVSIEALPRVIPGIAHALSETTISGTTVADLWQNSVTAQCVSCGITLAGSELNSAFLTKERQADPKLERIRLGFCARNGCRSKYYLVRLQEQTGIDWNELWARAEARDFEPAPSAPATDAAAADVERPPIGWTIGPLLVPRTAVVLGGLVLVLLIWWSLSGWRIPGLSPKPRVFIVDPSPVGP